MEPTEEISFSLTLDMLLYKHERNLNIGFDRWYTASLAGTLMERGLSITDIDQFELYFPNTKLTTMIDCLPRDQLLSKLEQVDPSKL